MRIAIISTYLHPSRLRVKQRSVLYPAAPELLAGLCPEDAEIEIYNEKERDVPLDRHWDLVFFSYLHPYYEHTKVLSTLLRAAGMVTVAGGRHARDYADDCLRYFDAVVVGEPESNVPPLIRDFTRGKLQKIYSNPPVDPADIQPGRYDLINFEVAYNRLPGIEASRGCPFACNFCVLPAGGENYRYRPVQHVVEEIRSKMRWNTNFGGLAKDTFIFLDNNLGGSPRYLRELCEALIPLKKRWGCSVTFNILCHEDLIKLMSRAGCRHIYTGLESLSPDSLKAMNKNQNKVQELDRVVRRLFSNGIVLTFGILVGSDGDTNEYLEKLPDYLSDLKLLSVSLLGFVSPIPGTAFFNQLRREGRLLPNTSIRDYDGVTLCHQPTQLSVSEAVDHYKRLCRTLGSLTNTVKHCWDRLGESRLPGYKAVTLAAAHEIIGLKRYLANKQRTFIGGQDPIEAWDRWKIQELGLPLQRVT